MLRMPAEPPGVLLVLCNAPDAVTAEALADHVLQSRLAACVNILPPCRSRYRWQGAVESAEEVPMLIKTSAAAYPRLEAALRERHPYELPEIIAVPLSRGLPAYLQWVADETA
jgi:periplasmic divalent cation tolerance protein